MEPSNVTHNLSKKGIMPEQIVDQSLNCRLNQRQSWKVLLGLLGVALLLALALGASAILNHLVPTVPDRAQGVTARVGWYLRSGQLQADVRTLAAAFEFIMAPECETPTITNFANLPVAEKAAPSSPKS
jgi:hypothetical protein